MEIALPKGWRRVRIATLLEVSEGGGLLKGDLGCSVGTELSVRLWFPGISDLLCTGVVRSARADRSFGVEWTNILPQNGDRLAEYVQCPPARHGDQWQSGQPAEPPEDGTTRPGAPLPRRPLRRRARRRSSDPYLSMRPSAIAMPLSSAAAYSTHMRPLSRARRHNVPHLARFSVRVCGATAETAQAPDDPARQTTSRYGG